MIEIVLLVLGIGVFAASFLIPVRKESLPKEDERLGQERIRELVEEQMKDVKSRVSDVVDETIQYAVEKTERSMERVTNEKIMAVSEYSDTVLEEIHKNHEEVVFLYDMLSDKQKSLKDTAAAVARTAKEVGQSIGREQPGLREQAVTQEQAMAQEKTPEPESDAAEQALAPEKEFLPLAVSEKIGAEDGAILGTEARRAAQEKTPDTEAALPESGPKSTGKTKAPAKTKKRASGGKTKKPESGKRIDVGLSFADSGQEGRNNNEKILALHKEGKSNMAIAKELGLGIGEVRLVIDLFKGA